MPPFKVLSFPINFDMNNKYKKIFLGLSIVVPFLLYSLYYYGMMVKNAPYKFTEFEELTIKYGEGKNLVNTYNSKTQQYQYLNSSDSLVKKRVKLNNADLLYLHRKAADLGFWNFPEHMEGSSEETGVPKVHYYLEFKYKRKTKHIDFDTDYAGKPELKDAVRRLIQEVDERIKDAESR